MEGVALQATAGRAFAGVSPQLLGGHYSNLSSAGANRAGEKNFSGTRPPWYGWPYQRMPSVPGPARKRRSGAPVPHVTTPRSDVRTDPRMPQPLTSRPSTCTPASLALAPTNSTLHCSGSQCRPQLMHALHVFLGVLCFVATTVASAHELYHHALLLALQLPRKYHHRQPKYTADTIHQGVQVPQYNATLHQYEDFESLPVLPGAHEVVRQLHAAADAGSVDATVALGDIYTFGNFSIPVNYTRAVAYYERAVRGAPHGHAYFMLGFMYSTGMFGEVEVDKTRSNVYYEFAAANNDLNAMLVLAYQNFRGVGRPENLALAQLYYSHVARVAMLRVHDAGVDPTFDFLPYDIRLPDFNGGLFGPQISESGSSVFTEVDLHLASRDRLRENDVDKHDSTMTEYYYDAIKDYHSSYFSDRNLTHAFSSALTCAYLGQQNLAGRDDTLVLQVDQFIWSRCMNLVGKMYLKGRGTERNPSRAHAWISSAADVYASGEVALNMAYLRLLDPVYANSTSPGYINTLGIAVTNGSTRATFLYADYLNGLREDPLSPTYTKRSYEFLMHAANNGQYEAKFYLADAVESGFADSLGEQYSTEDLLFYYKMFVDESENVLLPHLSYAFEEFRYGNFKNALVGYAMAAEQGLKNSQVSAAYLLYQIQPLLSWRRKTFLASRINEALRYLELASALDETDATLLLGNIFSEGIPDANVSVDYGKAFAYYGKAALAASPHGCYKLGYMYEYGLGSANNTVDFYLAKRYYDLSVKYYQEYRFSGGTKGNSYPISLALLRLRLKLLLSRDRREDPDDSSGWFSTLKTLGQSQASEEDTDAPSRADAHHGGGQYDGEEDFEIFDYMLLAFTVFFFLFMFLRNFVGAARGANRANGQINGEPAIRANFDVMFFAI